MAGPWDAIGNRVRRDRSATASAAGALDADPSEEFAWFFRQEFEPVARTVFLILRDRGRAEDVTQEAFVQLLRHWPKVSRYQMPEAWVRRVAIRLAVRASRRELRRGELERRADPGRVAAEHDPDLTGAVGRLSAAQRAAIALFYFEDRPVAQVADLMNCSVSTAKVHLHRARRRLRTLLGEEGDDDEP